MNRKIKKLWIKLNEFCGGSDGHPFNLKENSIEFEDDSVFIIAKYLSGYYYLLSNSYADFEIKSAGAMAERMHIVYMEQHLESQIWELYGQFKSAMKAKDKDLDFIECETGIEWCKIENAIYGYKESTVRDLHDAAWALGMKLKLVES